MMKPNQKAKWIVGISGTALSAMILGQLNLNSTLNNQTNQPVAYQNEASAENTNGLSDREQELNNKDWTNFTVESNTDNQTTNQPATDTSVSQQSVQQSITPPTNRNTSRS